MVDPLSIDRGGHRTWLKWHRGRRRISDPAFTGARILEGMRLGASVEVDLVIHADHGCAILHNLTLDEETTGRGVVRETGAGALRQLHLRDNRGTPLPDQVMLLEDLCELLDREPPHPDALLQLDFKEDVAALDAETIASIAASVGPHSAHMILSGGDAEAVRMLAETTPGLRTGYDPCYGDSLARLQSTGDFKGFIDTALRTAPDAEFIYLSHEIVLAADRDIVGTVHADGRRVDAWTIREVTPASLSQVDRLLALKVDQITTDDPEGLLAALES